MYAPVPVTVALRILEWSYNFSVFQMVDANLLRNAKLLREEIFEWEVMS